MFPLSVPEQAQPDRYIFSGINSQGVLSLDFSATSVSTFFKELFHKSVSYTRFGTSLDV